MSTGATARKRQTKHSPKEPKMSRYARSPRRQYGTADPTAAAMVIRMDAARSDPRFRASLDVIRADLVRLLDTCPTEPEAFPAWMLALGGWTNLINRLADDAFGVAAVPGAFGTTLPLRAVFNGADNQNLRLEGCRYYQEHRMGASS
jgi:hypothetical protein